MSSAYQGGDLSLRTPKAWGAPREIAPMPDVPMEAPEWLTRALSEAATQGPEIWVDSTVLKCCNQAYEIAVAHRAPEVRLEHLVHAMTLVPAAMHILQAEGISDATLRRESGVIIAHDLPSVTGGGKISPKTSEEMEEVLRYAAEAAYQHRSPVTIDDFLQTLFDMKRDLPTRNLLSRHREDWTLREPIEGRRYSERNRSPSEPPTMTDTVQNTRIDELERRVSDLLELLAAKEGGKTEVTYPAGALNGVAGHGASDLLSRLGDVEASVDRKFRELARTWNVLGERLQTVEDLLMDSDFSVGGGATISHDDWKRFAERIERLGKLEQLPARFERIEQLPERFERIDKFAGRLDRIDEMFHKLERLEPVIDKLDWIETLLAKLDRLDRLDAFDDLDKKISSVETTFSRVLHRIDEMEERLERRVGGFDISPVMAKLDQMEKSSGGIGNADLAPLDERMRELHSRIADQHLVIQSIGDRIDAFDSNVDTTRAHLAEAIEKGFANAPVGSGTFDLDKGDLVEAVRYPVTTTLAEIKSLVEQDRREQRDQFQQLVTGFERISSDYRADLSEVHEALLKLNSNQQTLAQSMDSWRADVSGQFVKVHGKLGGFEERFEKPFKALEEMGDRYATMGGTRVEQQTYTETTTTYEPEDDSLTYWLFGTHNWWSDGWRSPEERAELRRQEELQRNVATRGEYGYAQDPTQRRLHG